MTDAAMGGVGGLPACGLSFGAKRRYPIAALPVVSDWTGKVGIQ